ncbi:hypothetical protein MMC30_009083 [Trapelia coarctata]|nr:hypothetical protein [Trapelia coarctata]
MLSIVFFLLSSLSSLVAGHFLLNYPQTLGFSDDNEGEGPCGSFNVDFTGNVTNVTVDSFPVSLRSTHPQADWLFRVTLDKTNPSNWTNLLPVVSEIGLGAFCIPNLKAPAEFAGKQGVVQVVQDAVDGALYQCAAVNFVAGSNSSVGSGCTNVTGLTATISNQSAFSNATTSGTPSSTASMTGASATPTSFAVRLQMPALLSGCLAAIVLAIGFAAV